MKIEIDKVKVGERFRKQLGNIDALAISINKYGLLHPIVVDREFNLIAGRRRLAAVSLLKQTEIEVNFRDKLDEFQRKEIELEENLMREDMHWTEVVKAKQDLDELKKRIYGVEFFEKTGSGWSQEDTAESLGESVSLVQKDIALSRAMEVIPELRRCKTKAEAMRKLKNEKEKYNRAELLKRVEQKMKGKEDEQVRLICGDAVAVLREMESESVDMCVADPPFGVTLNSQVDASPAKGLYDTYEDEKGEVYETIRLVIREVGRVLKPNAHFYLFFPLGRSYPWFLRQLDEAFDFVDPLPIIWYKTNKAGAGYSGDTKKRYMLHYQPILFASKGSRPLAAAKSNVIPLDIILKGRENPAEMPSELMEYFIEQSSLPGETVLEVFAGTGPVVRAARRLKRMGVGVEKRQEQIDVIRVRMMEER